MKKIAACAFALTLLSGCATVVSDSDYTVSVRSNPEKASFDITNEAGQKVTTGVTPTLVTLNASAGFFQGETYTISFEKDGYHSQIYVLESGLDGWYIGNVLFGGLLGMLVIDPATGAMFSLPEEVDVTLLSSVSDEADSVTIVTLDELTEEQRSQLVAL